jgi:hypothetical protein
MGSVLYIASSNRFQFDISINQNQTKLPGQPYAQLEILPVVDTAELFRLHSVCTGIICTRLLLQVQVTL